ncbi:MAG: hypothetical protein QG625_989 [Cyanobacteriota bacterium erpe_2018_sw_39hr_WHONDRS-SW48-000098_B_bin.30]|nr:hypothetical protein [Cyanobacteriota bacterium erpe_2018_sw_39hr_WHONDRS-SW48-000098_B_bin.30]
MTLPASTYRQRAMRLVPWLLLACAISVFYDLTPFTHLPLPPVADNNWESLTKPTLLESTESEDKTVKATTLVTIQTKRGPISMHYYPGKDASTGLVVVGGIGTGFDSPAAGLYERLGNDLTASGVSTVHLCFRQIDPFPDTVHDVRAAVKWLNQLGLKKVIAIGHSLGGASVISAASYEPSVIGIATLCSQPYGANRVHTMTDKRLFIGAGLFDVVEPPCWSSSIYREARCDKQLHYYPAIHTLDSSGDAVYKDLNKWIIDQCTEKQPAR